MDEILGICFLFILAGLDTVTDSLECFVARLAQHPDERRQIVDDPSIIPSAVEELLRWETPVTTVARVATPDVDLGGCPIKKGENIGVVIGAANTDEEALPGADQVDLTRNPNSHLAFGGGVHRCLGSHLARLELRVALREWHRRIPEYSIVPGTELIYRGASARSTSCRWSSTQWAPEGRSRVDFLLTDDQQLFRETTRKFLEDTAPLDAVRRVADEEPGRLRPRWWRRGRRARLGLDAGARGPRRRECLRPRPARPGPGGRGDGPAGLTRARWSPPTWWPRPCPELGTGPAQAVLPGLVSGETVAAWCLGADAPASEPAAGGRR